jgi:deoxyadenosine/deoxycytidine kinase
METAPLVVLAGNIAAGKSTAARLVAEAFGWQFVPEPADEDVILRLFYEDMRAWTFTLNMHLLGVRAEQLAVAKDRTRGVVIDRSIFEDRLFVELALELGNTSRTNAVVFDRLFRTFERLLPPPDLLVYLRSSTTSLLQRARFRGRPFENDLSLEYLDALQSKYERWIAEYRHGPLIQLDTHELDLRTPVGSDALIAAVASALEISPKP